MEASRSQLSAAVRRWPFHHQHPKSAFSLVELLVVIMVIALLSSLLLLGLGNSIEKGKRTVCLNNEKQLAVAALLYAQENSKQRFSPNDGKGSPVMDLNWLQQAADIPVSVFRCPATKNLQFPKRKQYAEGSFYYFDLTYAALSRDSKSGYSYDLLPWFADMENYWNGNASSTKNSRRVPKTLGNISSYSHEHEAFGLQGKNTSPDVTWLFVDNDLLSQEPFWPKPTSNHQSKGANAAFTDGHVEWIKQQSYVYRYELSQDNNRTKDIPRPRL